MSARGEKKNESAGGPERRSSPSGRPAWTSFALLFTAVSLLSSGCATRRAAEAAPAPRVRLEFETPQATQWFYQGLASQNAAPEQGAGRNGSRPEVMVRVAHSGGSHRRVSLREAVRECDLNHDGVISEAEARAFAERGAGPVDSLKSAW